MQKNDIVLVPKDDHLSRQFFKFCASIFNLRNDQLILVDGLNANRLSSQVISLLKERMKGKLSWQLSVYAATPGVLQLAQELNVKLVCDPAFWMETFGSKSFLSSLSEFSVPLSKMCTTREELIEAFLYFERNKKRILLKVEVSSGGIGNHEIKSIEHLRYYKFPFGSVVLQELLDTDRDDTGEVCSAAIQFNGNEIMGVTDQLVKGYSFKGSSYPSQLPLKMQHKMKNIVYKILSKINPQGPGGCDFIIAHGEPFLVDLNVGRMTGVHPVWWFLKLYAPKKSFILRVISCSTSLDQWWDQLGVNRFCFETSVGSLPLAWGTDTALIVTIF